MSAMIPHHSIAIMTSARAEITVPRVRKLADSIIEAQVKEIAEMELLLKDIEENGEMGDGSALPARTTALTPKLRREAEKGVERPIGPSVRRSEEHTSELQSLMRISYAVFCLKKKTKDRTNNT